VNLPDGYRARPSCAADIDGVLAVLHARDLLEVGHPDSTPAFVEDAWRNPRFDVETDTLVVEAPDGTLAAYADVTHLDDPAYVTAWAPIHPAHRARGIGTAVLGWVETRAARAPAHALHQYADGGDEAGHTLLARAGYRQVRTHLHMIRELDGPVTAPPPEGIAIRPMREGDERAIHDVVRESFAEHFALTSSHPTSGGASGATTPCSTRPCSCSRSTPMLAPSGSPATSRTTASGGSGISGSFARGAGRGSRRRSWRRRSRCSRREGWLPPG